MPHIGKVLVGLAAVVVLAVIMYITFYNYQSVQDEKKLLDKVRSQHQKDIDNMLMLSTDINYNDKKLAEVQAATATRMEQIQISLVNYISDQQNKLLKELDIDNVRGQLSSTETTLLKQIVHTNSELLTTLVDKESSIHSRIDDLQSSYLQNIVTSTEDLHIMLQRNIDALSKVVNTYKTDNTKNVESLRIALHALTTTVARHKDEDAAALAAQKNMLTSLVNTAEQHIDNLKANIAQTAADASVSPITAYITLLNKTLFIKNGKIGILTSNPATSLEIMESKPRIRLNGAHAGLEMGLNTTYSRVMMDGNNNMHLLTNNSEDIYLQGQTAQMIDLPTTAGNGRVVIGRPTTTTYTNPTAASLTLPNATGSTVAQRKLMLNGSMGIYGNGDLEFGNGAPKGEDNGKIAYQKWSIDALDITGAGNLGNINNRKVKVWAEGGSEFTGPVKVSSLCQLSAIADSSNVNINNLSSGCAVSAPGLIVNDTSGLNTIINNIKISSGEFGTYTNNNTEKAEICNDTTKLKALVISGNRAATNVSSARTVKILDNLEVTGTIIAGGNIKTLDKLYASQDVVVTSDRRLKSDIRPITNALDKVKTLNGCTFIRNGKNERSTGLIAQDVQNVLPEAVSTGKDGYMSVGYGNMVGLLVEAIKNLDAKLDAQTQRV